LVLLFAVGVVSAAHAQGAGPPDAVSGALVAPPSAGSGRVYSLDELCRSALEANPRIHEREYRAAARKTDITLERNDLLPALNLNANHTEAKDTSLSRAGARIIWWSDWSELRMRDVKYARLGYIRAEEFLRREKVWVLNDVAHTYRQLAVMEMRVDTYERIIELTEDLHSDEPGFELERDLKIDEYLTELTRTRDSIVDFTSRLSSLAFGDPYGTGLLVNPSSVRYREVPIDRKAVVRRSVRERMRPSVLELERSEVRIKTSTRRYQPSVSASVERWQVEGSAGQGFTDSDTTMVVGINYLLNPFASKATRNRARAEFNVGRARALVDLNDLINSAERALDRFEQAKENVLGHYDRFGKDQVDFGGRLAEIYGAGYEVVDRQVFTTLDLLLKNDLKRIEYLSAFDAAVISLNNHVMITPLDQHLYADLDPDNTMPEIFEYLPISDATYERHRRQLLSP
jgi:hypothetical protein